MILSEIDRYFHEQDEPLKSCLLCLRDHILALDPAISEGWRYSMPFYFWNGKRFCYLWVHKKKKLPYIGLVDGYKINHPKLLQEKRSRMRIILLDPVRDLPVRVIDDLLKDAIAIVQGSRKRGQR